jgi:hypothetical protein
LVMASLVLVYLFSTPHSENIETYRFEYVDLLYGTVEDGAILFQILLHHIVARRASFADSLHLEFHLRWVSRSIR